MEDFMEKFSDYKLDLTPSEELMKNLKKVENLLNPDTFKGSISASWRIGEYPPCRPSTFEFSNFIGDVIFMGIGFTIVGTVNYKHNLGQSGNTSFYVEYSQDTDILSIQVLSDTYTVKNTQSTTSPVQLRYDLSNKKVIIVFRQNVPADGLSKYGFYSTSFITLS
jgi:hypothetical protein